MKTRLVALFVAAAAGGAVTVVAAPAGATSSGPALTVQRATVLAALACSGDLTTSTHNPVLFLHGTTSNSKADWSWNWNLALQQRHWAYCDLDLPDSGNGDIQVSAEYVVTAIRTMHTRGLRKISLVGHSQGGMIGRWALKYWPDIRGMVDDYVGLASSNHGTKVFNAVCAAPIGCDAANWQQSQNSHFLTALNKGTEAYPGISYTEIATKYDEVVVPYTSVFLAGGTNVLNTTVQDLCKNEVVEHSGMSADNAAWVIGMDALTHAGPAKLSRVAGTDCSKPFMPAVDLASLPANVVLALAQTGQSLVTAKRLTSEPALRSYAQG